MFALIFGLVPEQSFTMPKSRGAEGIVPLRACLPKELPRMTATPIFLLGTSALSPFRSAGLIKALSARCPTLDISAIEATHLFVAASPGQRLTAEEERLLSDLVGATERFDGKAEGSAFFVMPRRGTISPWSSKATEIAQRCGLGGVSRIESGIKWSISTSKGAVGWEQLGEAISLFFDRMTQGVLTSLEGYFRENTPARGGGCDLLARGRVAIEEANQAFGLALSDDEIGYLVDTYMRLGRNPTDTELMMFGQVNSEHCRHKIFNGSWIIDGETKEGSLFDMIKTTHQRSPRGTRIAYSDNSGCIEGFLVDSFERSGNDDYRYEFAQRPLDIIMKVETHNHPTAIAPHPGAGTGVGGEIRDEGSTGRGSKSKAGLSAFFVSHLHVPGWEQPWEKKSYEHPSRIATPLQIMLDGPIGGAAFSNEFGRPQLCGVFRTFELHAGGTHWGYHKPIMVAGGMGSIHREHEEKDELPPGAYIIQLGGPSLRIGIGGGAASSMDTGSNAEELDFNSVQRANPEMQRRCQEVIDACVALGEANPIRSIHDVGAGGLSNACPELVEGTGATLQLRSVHNQEPSMSPMEVWCNESQERYVLAVLPEDLDAFVAICARERCPYAALGQARADGRLVVRDDYFDDSPVDLPLEALFGKPPRMVRSVGRLAISPEPFRPTMDIETALGLLLRFPAIARKNFLITIGDRSVGGLVARDQCAGPFQTPIADCAVTASGFRSTTGEAMAMGERPAIAVLDAAASARMAIGEAITNIMSARIGTLGDIKLSANWMAACGEPGQDAQLWDGVEAVARKLCPALGISIPVGKDSLSMKTVWSEEDKERRVVSPVSLVVSAFAPVLDITQTLTPDIKGREDSSLLFIDLAGGQKRLGGSAVAQVAGRIGGEVPDVDDPDALREGFELLQELNHQGLVRSYHDRSDGGLLISLLEMAFGARCGLSIDLSFLGKELSCQEINEFLWNEELGYLIEVRSIDVGKIAEAVKKRGRLSMFLLGSPTEGSRITVTAGGKELYAGSEEVLNRMWSELSYEMQRLRDNPECAAEEFAEWSHPDRVGLTAQLCFDPEHGPALIGLTRPRVALLREQGVNGHVEMAAAFHEAGFESVDVHMSDLLGGRISLAGFSGLVGCGGFSYGDVLGAGVGWAQSILHNAHLSEEFSGFFARPETFTLGVCNGCQMISQLKGIIPGAAHWPRFVRNRSEQFEARLSMVKVVKSPSVLLADMEGSLLPIPVAHGEGLVQFTDPYSRQQTLDRELVGLRFVNGLGEVTERYPTNPNGSESGITCVTSEDGRATIMMPHPERAFRAVQLSYNPGGVFRGWGPWFRLFQNARRFVG